MPQIQFAKISPANIDAPYFSSLNDLDTWAASSSNHKLDGVLRYIARADDDVSSQRGKLLVCHDYKAIQDVVYT
ncbi:hypothetical protein E4T56_gene9780 [Termitomyces sp. T112]|nr:hypothetical protein E4T56_gene9780 [Termitomyces sp. T112]